MPNEDKVLEKEKETENPLKEDYIEQIQNLKANTVNKEEYEKLVQENKKLIGALVDGKNLPAEVDDVKSVEDYKKVLANPDSNNLEYCTALLGVRNCVLEEKGIDIFLQPNASVADREAAEAVAKTIQEAIDYCDGDSQLFTQELQRRTVDYKTGK